MSVDEARIAECVRAACLLECTARKPGNVHPQAAFEDLCHADFVTSAEVAAPILARASSIGVGRCVRDAVEATRAAVGKNTNLGIALLTAPLAAVDGSLPLSDGIDAVLDGLTAEDAAFAYEAIRIASPGGMGRVDAGDVSESPAGTLLEMMQLAADRDAVAGQYAGRFATVLRFGLGTLARMAGIWPDRWEQVLVGLHLELMAAVPDTLIARKCGAETAAESARRAQTVLSAGWPDNPRSRQLLSEFDDWLRADGHRRNPGTTADLVTASLFAAFREGKLPLPGGEFGGIVSATGFSD